MGCHDTSQQERCKLHSLHRRREAPPQGSSIGIHEFSVLFLPQLLMKVLHVLICKVLVQGTFYGQQSGQNDWGACSYGKSVSNTLGLQWHTGVEANIALNNAQFQGGLACGMCLYFRGTGQGIGVTPLPTSWQFGFVDNL